MIIAERKPINEIKAMISRYKKILIMGCGTCVTICWAGGEKEVSVLSSLLTLALRQDGKEIEITGITPERQCEKELLEPLADQVRQADAVLSIGCGAGVQIVADKFNTVPVFPGLNTKFLGAPLREGLWVENCSHCGDCVLDETGGICPVTRCAKGLLNGPCGGTNNGKCEVDKEKDCAWTLIYQQLERQGRLDLMKEYRPPRNFQAVIRPGKVSVEPR